MQADGTRALKLTLTACLIVRNEEQYLSACLSEITPFTDSIVVVDTGSTDRSRQIAREHGALLIEEPWRDDFSQARNLALDHARGDWILYIDADERLQARPGDFDCLNDPGAVAATVGFRASAQLTRYREHRLFRNRPDIRFRGVIHETVTPDIDRIVQREQLQIIHTSIGIEHLGYEGDLSHKHRRNHGMLLKAVRDDPGRIYLWHALGECELGLGHAFQAEEAWRTALKQVRQQEDKAGNALIYTDLIRLHFAATETALDDIAEIVSEAARLHGSDPLVKWWQARYFISVGEIPAARVLLEPLLRANNDQAMDSPLAYDRRLFGSLSWALLGNCDLAEQAWDDAFMNFHRALEADPGNTEVAVKMALARAKSGRKTSRDRI